MSRIATSVSYEYGENNPFWGIPFPYGNEGQVGVSVTDANGLERALKSGEDYRLDGSRLIHFLKPGQRLNIWLAASLASAIAGFNERGNAARVQNEAAQVYAATAPGAAQVYGTQGAAQVYAAAEPVDPGETVSGLKEEMAAYAKAAVADEANKALLALAQAADDLKAAGVMALRNEAEAKTLEIRNAEASLNRAITQSEAVASEREKVLAAVYETKNAVQEASESAAEAGKAATRAGEFYQSFCQCQGESDCWTNEAKRLAFSAYDAAVIASRAAAQCSVHHTRPGIAVVKDITEIHCASPGLFIVNPCLTHSPSPFFGVYPARCVDDIKGEAVYFIGEPYPEDACPPPWKPVKPPVCDQNPAGDGDDWLPCHHKHMTCARK